MQHWLQQVAQINQELLEERKWHCAAEARWATGRIFGFFIFRNVM